MLLDWLGLPSLWHSVTGFFTSPIWFWVGIWLATLAVSWVIGWFFQSLRPYLGVVLVILGAFIVGMYHGMKKQKERQRPVRPVPRPQNQDPFAWLWPSN